MSTFPVFPKIFPDATRVFSAKAEPTQHAIAIEDPVPHREPLNAGFACVCDDVVGNEAAGRGGLSVPLDAEFMARTVYGDQRLVRSPICGRAALFGLRRLPSKPTLE